MSIETVCNIDRALSMADVKGAREGDFMFPPEYRIYGLNGAWA